MPEHMHSGAAHAIGSRPAECVALGFEGPGVGCDRAGWFDPARPLVCRHAEPPPGGTGWQPYSAPPAGTGASGGTGGSPYGGYYGGAGGGGAGGGALTLRSGGTLTTPAPPVHPFADPARVPGDPEGTVRFRRRAGYASDRNDPLQVVEIPCNPDAVGEQRVTLQVTRAAAATGTVGAGLAGVMKSTIQVEFPKDHEIEVDHVFKGERCRSVRYEIFVQSIVFDVELTCPARRR